MQCWQCGRTVRQGAKLCIYCGAKLAEDDEEEAPRGAGSRASKRTPEPGAYRSSVSRDDEDARRAAPPYGESEEYPTFTPPTDRDERYARRERPSPRSREDDDPGRSPNYPRPRDQRPLDPMDDPRAPFSRARGTTSPGRERRDPDRYDDMRSGAENGPPGYAAEERPRRASRAARDDEWGGGGGEPRPSHGPRRESRDDYAGYDGGRDGGRASSSSSSRRRSDMEYEGGYPPARGDRGEGYDDRYERGSSRDRPPSRGPQVERDWERADPRGGYRGDARGAPYPPSPLDDSWGLPAVGGGLSNEWDVAPSEELPAPPPRGGRVSGGRDARGRSGSPAKGQRQGGGGRVFLVVVLVLVVIGLIGAGVVLAPKVMSRFGGTKGSDLDTQPPFATYTPGPSPTPLAKYSDYVGKHVQFAINYPKEWSSAESSDASQGQSDYVATFTQPAPQAALLVEQSGAFDAVGNDELIHDEVLAGQNGGSTFTETIGSPARALIGGEQWLRREYVVVAKDGTKLHMAILSCHHKGHGYVIVLVSLPQNFAHDDQTTFQSMLSTFRFLA